MKALFLVLAVTSVADLSSGEGTREFERLINNLQEELLSNFKQLLDKHTDALNKLQEQHRVTRDQVSDLATFLKTATIEDECAEGTNNCSPNAVCRDTYLHFSCSCNPGFAGDGISCEEDSAPILEYQFSSITLQPVPSPLSLKCVASGVPKPYVSWMLDGFPLVETERLTIGQHVGKGGSVISHINMTDVRAEDGGAYTCQAINRAGSASHTERVNVYGIPYVRPMPVVSVVAEETLVIHCPASGYPLDRIVWYKNDRILPINRRQEIFQNGTLIIKDVMKTADSGDYTCKASDRDQSHSQTVTVRVLDSNCKGPFKKIEGHGCIMVTPERGTWYEVKSFCESKGARLLQDFRRDQYYISSSFEVFNFTSPWVGIENGKWEGSGSPIPTDLWGQSQPYSFDEDACGVLNLQRRSNEDGIFTDKCSSPYRLGLCQAL